MRNVIALTVLACGCTAITTVNALPPPKFHLEPVRATPKHTPDPTADDTESASSTATTSATPVVSSKPTATAVTSTVTSKPAAAATTASTVSSKPKSTVTIRDSSGGLEAIPVVTKYQPNKIVHPFAKYDRHVGASLMRAATIAQERAHAHSRSMCWHYVKEALVAAGVVPTRPKTELAKDAAAELVNVYGFHRLAVRDPYLAPIGSVLVYGSARAAGHIEFRTRDGFVSDFKSKTPSRRPLLGVYAKS